MENMVEGGKAVIDHFGKKIVFINVMRNMSIDCDCAGTSAAKPTVPDYGILASTDILALDKVHGAEIFQFCQKHSLWKCFLMSRQSRPLHDL